MDVRLCWLALGLSLVAAACASSSPDTGDAAAVTGDAIPGGSDATVDGAQPAPTGPEITVTPEDGLDLGSVPAGGAASLTFTIRNDGDGLLTVASVAKGAAGLGIWGDVTIDTAVTGGTTIAPSSTVPAGFSGGPTVTVTFAPTQVYPTADGPIGYIEITSDDADEPVLYVPIRARVSQAELQLTPDTTLDFGQVGEGQVGATRLVTLANVGDLPLTVTATEIASYTVASTFGLVSPPSLPFEIAPGATLDLTVRVVNEGGPDGKVLQGALTLTSDASEAPRVIALVATRFKGGKCVLSLDPPSLDFGLVRYGESKTLTMAVKNVGTAACSPFSVNAFDAYVDYLGEPIQCQVKGTDTGKQFVVVAEPPAIKDLLLPGDGASLQVRYAPEEIWYSMGTPEIAGLVQVTMLDYGSPDDAQDEPFDVEVTPPGAVGDVAECNLQGTAGKEDISANQTKLDFGVIEVGCASRTELLRIYNRGGLPLRICDVHLAGSAVFSWVNAPTIPPCDAGGAGGLILDEGQQLEVAVRFVPTVVAASTGSIVVLSSDLDTPEFVVPLSAQSVGTKAQTDTFQQKLGSVVDVLLVVDDGVTMTNQRAELAAAISSLLAKAANWNADLHLGVIATGAPDDSALGWLETADGTQPRFFTNATTAGLPASIIAVQAPNSTLQKGLEAAYRAVTSPLTDWYPDTPKVCVAASDCVPPAHCVESVLSPTKRYCAQPNTEFLHNSGHLELIIVSDRDDFSPSDPASYAAAMPHTIPETSQTGLGFTRAHAIVGDSVTGCTGPITSAASGDRYATFATATGGTVTSLCSVNWAQTLAQIGQEAFALQSTFVLSRRADPSTLVVTVAGAACAQGWTFDEEANAVVFDLAGPCAPGPSAAITASYDAVCLAP